MCIPCPVRSWQRPSRLSSTFSRASALTCRLPSNFPFRMALASTGSLTARVSTTTMTSADTKPRNCAKSMHPPENRKSCCLDKAIEGFARIQAWVGLLAQQDFLFSGGCIDFAQFLGFVSALVIVVVETLAVREPVEARAILKGKFDGSLHVNALARLNVEDNRLGLCQDLTGQGIHISKCARPQLVRRNELQARKPAGVPRVNAVGNQFRGIGRPKHSRRLLYIFRSLVHHHAQ